MDNLQYIEIGALKSIIQTIPDSNDGDSVTIEIRRLSDGYTWNFTSLAFTSAATTGTMTFVNGIAWKQTFTPPTQDTYIVTITHAAHDVKYAQVFEARSTTPPTATVTSSSDTSASGLLAQVKSVIAARLIGGAVKAYSIGGRNLSNEPLEYLFELRDKLQREVNVANSGAARNYAQFDR